LLFPPTDLRTAIERLGFVQADPIRSPAPAQDLILRHRVTGYRVDDLARAYSSLDVEEGTLYAYGFMTRGTWQLLRPLPIVPLSYHEQRVIEILRTERRLRPRDLDEPFGGARVRGEWGGQATAGKHALDRLHRRGLIRVAGRENGNRVYEAAPDVAPASPIDRLRGAALIVAASMGPVPTRSLQATLAPIGRALAGAGAGRAVLKELVQSGVLVEETFDGIAYVTPPASGAVPEPESQVRLLAPFDPIVRDRARFEHLWGWTYRFEAYTPETRRLRGYYAMPLLWRDTVIGWANVTMVESTLDVHVGFVRARPGERAFGAALDREVARLESFLGCAGKARRKR
jgi:uncharacterized protein YcaQ